MSLQLTGQDIADGFTLEEIQTKIDEIMAAHKTALEAKLDQLDDMQARQKVERQSMLDLNTTLKAWLKAKAIKTGADSATAELVAANYTGIHR